MQDTGAAQGSKEWLQERCGKVTASRFKDVMTGGKGRTRNTYMLQVMSEILTGRPREQVKAASLSWGNENEPAARAMYSWEHDCDVRQVGFVKHVDNELIGCSLDGVVVQDSADVGNLELKCPYDPSVHLNNLLTKKLPKKHEPQVQGGMWLTGMDWCDFGSYDPRVQVEELRLSVIRIDRDELYISELEEKVLQFVDQIKVRLSKIGYEI